MTDLHDLPGELVELFGSTATDAEIPPLPLRDVLDRGEELQRVRRRRAAIWTAAAAAVAVVAVSVPLALTSHGEQGAPAPAHRTATALPSPVPNGVPAGPTDLPYLAHHILHLDGQEITTPATNLLSHGNTTLMWSTKSQLWWQVRDGRAEQLGPPPPTKAQPWAGWHGVSLSPDGHVFVVLTHPTQNTSRITAYDGATDGELDHVDLPLPFSNWTGGGDSVGILGANDVDQVFWYQEGSKSTTWWMWTPRADAPVQLHTSLDASGIPYPPSGAVTNDGRLVTFSFLGEATRLAGVDDIDDAGAVWSPSGRKVAYGSAATEPRIAAMGGATVSPRLPGSLLTWVGFESDAYVLGVVLAVDGSRLVRCATGTGACATIETLPSDWSSWQWATTPPVAIAKGPADSSDASSSASSADDSVVGLPRGDDARIPVIQDGGIVMVNGRAIAKNVNTVVASSDQSVMLLVRHGTVSAITRARKEMPLDALDGVIQEPPPVLSPDGQYAAAVHTGEQGDELVEWSLASNHLAGSVPVVGSAEKIKLNGIDNDGRVYATTFAPRSGFSWKPGGARQPLTGAAAELASDGSGAVGPHGVVEAAGCDGTYSGISPSGSEVLCSIHSAPGLGIVSVTTHHVVPLGLSPALAGAATGVGFESEDAVLLVVKSTGGDWLVRCSTTRGTCVRARPVPTGTSFPMLP